MITLQKSHETAGVHLRKRGVDTNNLPSIRTGLCLDVSGSMHHAYRDGHVQDALTHLLGLAMHMDKSHRLDTFTFENDCAQCRFPATPENYERYVQEHILADDSVPKWGGTDYLGVMHLVYQHYFPSSDTFQASASSEGHHGLFGRLFHHESPAAQPMSANTPASASLTPSLVFFLTDGETGNERAIERYLEEQVRIPLFWVFVGLEHRSRLLEDLGSEPDAEFILLEDGLRISDEQLYSRLVTPKLAKWLSRVSA